MDGVDVELVVGRLILANGFDGAAVDVEAWKPKAGAADEVG